jgi:hypothetical protein
MSRRRAIPRPRPHALALALVLVLLSGLALSGCEIVKPELPSYTTHVAVPLGEERLDIVDLIDDEDYLVALEDGTLGFQVDGDPDTVALELDLSVDVDPQSIVGEVGVFDLAVPTPPRFDFTLVDLYPDAAGLDGMTMPVPAFSFDSASDAEDVADLESATVASGQLTVTVSNGLPVPVSAASGPDRLVLEVVDPATGQAVVILPFDVIAAGGQAIEAADLAGLTLPGALAVRIQGGSPGSQGSPVLVDAGAAISVEAAFVDLTVSAAEAVLEDQEFSTSFTTELPDDYLVEQAIIAAGEITLAVVNEMPIPCQAVVAWPTVRDLDDAPLELVVDLPPMASGQRSVDFTGHVLRAPDGATLTELVAEVRVTSPGSEGQTVLLAADQGVRADLDGGRIEFASVTGEVPEFRYDLDPIVENVDLPDEIDGVSLTRASMVLELTNTAGIAATADLQLVGTSEAGEQHTLIVQRAIEAADGERAAMTRIVLDETNSEIVGFLNNLPTEIVLSGGVDLGGSGIIGTVRADDVAVVGWQIVAPVEVVIESSHLYGDPDDLDLDEDLRESIADHAGAASVQLEILNHLPVGVEARILFSPDSTTIKTDPLLAIGPVAVEAARVDPLTRTVAEARVSHTTIALSASEVQALAVEGLYEIFEVILPSTDGQTVRVLTSDYVEIHGLIDLDVLVHDDDD